MTAVIPRDRAELVQFGVNHGELWVGEAAAIGLTAPQATAVRNAAEAAFTALTAAEQARQASKAATASYYAACATLRDKCSVAVKAIKLYADNQATPATVYAAAQIPAPMPPGPPQAPGKPFELSLSLLPTGACVLAWKCSNPEGVSRVIYSVRRALDGAGTYTLLDSVGDKRFTDETLPAGTQSVSYLVTAKHGSVAGPMSDAFTARFGVAPGGGLFVAQSGSAPVGGVPMKMAA